MSVPLSRRHAGKTIAVCACMFLNYKRRHSLRLNAGRRNSDPGSAPSRCLYVCGLKSRASPKHLTAELVLAPRSASEVKEDQKPKKILGNIRPNLAVLEQTCYGIGVTDGSVTR